MPHAFISYVRENAYQVDRLVLDLYRHGIDTWTDRKHLFPGVRWKPDIRKAIQDGVSFLACFSPEAVTQKRSYMYEEIIIAIETLRQMPLDSNWFIPVVLEECEIPAWDIGAGHTLRDLQWVDMFSDWETGVTSIVSVIRQSLTYEQPLLPDSREPRLPPLRKEPSQETFNAWRSVWSTLFRLKIAGEALFNGIDEETMREYATCLDQAISLVGESAFFFDRDDFEQLNMLLQGALTFRAGKKSILDARDAIHSSRLLKRDPCNNIEDVFDAIKHNIDEFEKFCRLLSEIRDRYSLRTSLSMNQKSKQKSKRSEKKLKELEEAAAHSQREANVIRAAVLAVRRGEISLGTDCPHGHGKLKDWQGMPRCWTCGWPWKGFDIKKS